METYEHTKYKSKNKNALKCFIKYRIARESEANIIGEKLVKALCRKMQLLRSADNVVQRGIQDERAG